MPLSIKNFTLQTWSAAALRAKGPSSLLTAKSRKEKFLFENGIIPRALYPPPRKRDFPLKAAKNKKSKKILA
jgi:hypothetical protein